MPPQGLWPGVLVESERWIEAPQAKPLIQAFAGKLQPDRGASAPPSTTTTTVAPRKESSSSSSALPWILGGVAVVLVGGGAAWLISRARSKSESTAAR
jgi:hypothetical protein